MASVSWISGEGGGCESGSRRSRPAGAGPADLEVLRRVVSDEKIELARRLAAELMRPRTERPGRQIDLPCGCAEKAARGGGGARHRPEPKLASLRNVPEVEDDPEARPKRSAAPARKGEE